MILHDREELDFTDVIMLPLASNKAAESRDHVDITRTFSKNVSRGYEWTGIPIIAANMDTVGTFEMAEAMIENNCCTALHKHYTLDELINFFKKHNNSAHLLFYTMGISDSDFTKFEEFCDRFDVPRNICIDVANGYMPHFAPFVTKVREYAPMSIIMAGNVVTGDHTQRLINAGASIVKVGLGSGSACLTRRITGVGRPQFSAVMECARAAHAVNGLICSDGGCVDPGDVAKAIGGGADFVMLGGMLAGHNESGGKIIYENIDYERPYHVTGTTNPIDFPQTTKLKLPVAMEFYGMASDTAMEKYNGGVAKYKASEGRTLRIPYRGPVKNTIDTILGGIRSSMMYIGADELKQISKCAEFIKVRRQLNTSLSQYES